jgi:hypothetical protein
MNKLLATLVAGTFAVVASSAFAQTPAPAPAKPKYDEKAAQALSDTNSGKTAAEQAKVNTEKSKMQPKSRPGYSQQTAEKLSDQNAGDAQNQAANVAASKASGPRQKIDISKMSKQEKQELLRQLQKESTP